jgi:GT2 family glycosyltransferase
MALIALACFDTEDNNRTEYTKRTLHSLMQTVNMAKHRIHVIDNASCKATKKLLQDFAAHITIHTNGQNLGTAKAVNIAWKERQPGEHCVKMDNDVVIHQKDWCDDLEKSIELDPKIGIVGLKRKDCWENPNHEQLMYRSELKLLGGGNNKWLPIEKVNHVMGTCQMFNSDLLDKIGYLYQPRLYGFDDSLAAIRCQVAGFYSCFIPSIEIDHIDTGETPYQKWKEKHSGEDMRAFNELKNAYINGTKSIYSESTW